MCVNNYPGIVDAQNFVKVALKSAQAPWSPCCIKILVPRVRFGCLVPRSILWPYIRKNKKYAPIYSDPGIVCGQNFVKVALQSA